MATQTPTKATKAKKVKKGEAPVQFDENGDPIVGTVYEWPDPAKPSALLLPQYIRDRRANAKTKKITFYAVVGTVAAVALGAVFTTIMAQRSIGAEEAAQNELDSAQRAVAAFAPVAEFYDGIAVRQTSLIEELGSDIEFHRLTAFLATSLPETVGLSLIEVSPGSPCASPDPFTAAPLLGCVRLSGSAPTESRVVEYLAALKALPEGSDIVQPFIVNLTENPSEGGFTFLITVNYTPGALSNRFLPEDQIPADQAAASADPATGTATEDGTATDGSAPVEEVPLTGNGTVTDPEGFDDIQDQVVETP